MAQREYDERLVEAAQEEIQLLEQLGSFYCNNAVENIFEKMPVGKQLLVNPFEETEEQFIERWMSLNYDNLPFWSDSKEYYSNSGIRMRSKSETLIANMLDMNNIKYRYEAPVFLNGVTVHPDFTLLKSKQRRVIYWEHFGKMDDPDYVHKAIRKLDSYAKSGYILGMNLFVTMESSLCPLNIKTTELCIRRIMEE